MERWPTLPARASMLEGSEFGYNQPGVQVTDFDTGPRLVRDWSGGRSRQTYQLNLYLDGLVPGVDDWAAFLRNTRNGLDPFIVVEPIVRLHHDLPMYPLPDGSRTVFYAPINGATELYATVDDEYASISMTLPTGVKAVNALSVEQATCTPADGSDDISASWDDAVGTATIKAAPLAALVGARGLLINKGAPAPGHGIETPDYVDITGLVHVNYELAGGCWVNGDGDYTARLRLYTGAVLEATNSATVSCTAGVWTLVSVDTTNASYINQARLDITADDSVPLQFMLDAPFITNANAPAWTNPGSPMQAVELLTAPAAGSVLKAHGKGYRASLVRSSKSGAAWDALATGRGVPDGINVTEEQPTDG